MSVGDQFFVSLLIAVFAYILLWLGALRSLFAVAGALDGLLTDSMGETVFAWKTRFLGSRQDWAFAVLEVLEAISRRDLLSWAAVRRSAVIAVAGVALLFGLWCAMSPLETIRLMARAPASLLGTLLVVTAVIGVLPNYLALIETRVLLALARRGRRLAVFLIVDLLLTALIAGAMPWPFYAIVGESEHLSHFWLDMIEPSQPRHFLWYYEQQGEIIVSLQSIHSPSDNPETTNAKLSIGVLPLWIWSYTVFLTSFTVWLLGLIRVWGGSFLDRLPWREKPFSCIAFISSILISLVFAIGVPLVTARVYSDHSEDITQEEVRNEEAHRE